MIQDCLKRDMMLKCILEFVGDLVMSWDCY